MSAHSTEQFNLFMSQLRETNATLDFYCDFPKIARNVADIEISLNMLNFLIGKGNLREAVQSLWDRYPHVFEVMDILIATRKKDDKKYIDNDGSMHSVHSLFSSVDGVMKFLEGTGLDKLFKNKEVKDLVDITYLVWKQVLTPMHVRIEAGTLRKRLWHVSLIMQVFAIGSKCPQRSFHLLRRH